MSWSTSRYDQVLQRKPCVISELSTISSLNPSEPNINAHLPVHVHKHAYTHLCPPTLVWFTSFFVSCRSVCPGDFWLSQKKLKFHSHNKGVTETRSSHMLNSSKATVITSPLASVSYSNNKPVVQIWDSFVQMSSALFIKMYEISLRGSGNWGTSLFQ